MFINLEKLQRIIFCKLTYVPFVCLSLIACGQEYINSHDMTQANLATMNEHQELTRVGSSLQLTDSPSITSEVMLDSRFDPLVKISEDSETFQYTLNPVFKEEIQTLIKVIDFSYIVAREKADGDKLESLPVYQELKTNWDIQLVQNNGTGKRPFPGMVLFSPKKKIVVISFRGSMDELDWAYNFQFKPLEKTTQLILSHGGIAKAAEEYEKELFNILDDIISSLSPNEREHLVFFVVGHSLGGALADITGYNLVNHLKMKNYWPNFDNNKKTRVMLYRLSPPRILSDRDQSYDEVNHVVGKYNSIRHNFLLDLIPNLPFKENKLMQSIFNSFKGWLGDPTGHKSTGILALQTELIGSDPSIEGINDYSRFIYDWYTSDWHTWMTSLIPNIPKLRQRAIKASQVITNGYLCMRWLRGGQEQGQQQWMEVNYFRLSCSEMIEEIRNGVFRAHFATDSGFDPRLVDTDIETLLNNAALYKGFLKDKIR